MTLFLKPIRPKKKIDPNAQKIYYAVMYTAMRDFAHKVIQDYYKIKRTWENKPRHESIIECEPKFPAVSVLFGATGDDQAVKEWNFVNEGTKVRRAIMSKDWKSKSSVKHIGSSAGRGHVVFISKDISLPGIKARKFDEAISENWNPRWKNIVIKAMKTAKNASQL
jgi:hypothetical protein